MRGDSIRDLYAKTLALLGLGVLAGTGALVDYWPSGVRLPAVESSFVQPELSLALAVPTEDPIKRPVKRSSRRFASRLRVRHCRGNRSFPWRSTWTSGRARRAHS